jgi:hypothetical protein
LQPLPSLMQARDTLKQTTSCLVGFFSMFAIFFAQP